jgi:hypothetical protein
MPHRVRHDTKEGVQVVLVIPAGAKRIAGIQTLLIDAASSAAGYAVVFSEQAKNTVGSRVFYWTLHHARADIPGSSGR